MFVVNTTGGNVFVHEINGIIPSGDGIYQIADSIKENYPQLSKIPSAIVKRLDDTAMELDLAKKRIIELEKNSSGCQGNCQCRERDFPNLDNVDFENINKLVSNTLVEKPSQEQPVKRGRGRPFKKV
jgi:hypothetical protein